MKDKRMSFPFIGRRINLLDLTNNLCNNLNVKVKIYETKSTKKAYSSLFSLIKQESPVMIHVDMPYLTYLPLPLEAHFGGHTVVIAEINEEESQVCIVDTGFDTLQTATLLELAEARASEFKPFPPKNRWFTFESLFELTSLNQAILKSISKVTDFMLNSPVRNMGIKGIRHFAEEISSWHNNYPSKDFDWGYTNTYIFLEKDGTGGGCFRYLFARFLKEAGKILDDLEIYNQGSIYHRIGLQWTKLSNTILNMSLEPECATEAKKTLLNIADYEPEALLALRSIIKEYK